MQVFHRACTPRGIVGGLCALVCALALFGGIAAAQAGVVLTNGDVVKMVHAQLGTRVIIATIESSDAQFDVTPAGLIALKEAGVGNEVIEAMQAKMRGTARTEPVDRTAVPTPEKPERPADVLAPAVALRTFKTMFVDASGAVYFGAAQVKAALAKNKQFAPLNITVVDDRAFADVVLKVNYTFAWDYPFTLTHQDSTVVLLSGKGTGPFSGPAGASSVADELVKALKPYRTTGQRGS